MGIYIEVPHHLNKARQLVELHEAIQTLPPEEFSDVPADKFLICVVENGYFDAAAVAYSESEFKAFLPTERDDRPRTWLLMDRVKVDVLTNGAATMATKE